MNIYSRLKYLRSHIPAKSELETELDYQQKIKSLNLPVPFIDLELSPYRVKYDPNKQQLHISLDTISRHFEEYSSFPKVDKKLALTIAKTYNFNRLINVIIFSGRLKIITHSFVYILLNPNS